MSNPIDRRPRSLADWPYTLPVLPPDRFWAEPTDIDDQAKQSSLFCHETGDPFDIYSYRVTKVLHAGRTAFQNIVIADSASYGRILLLDGAIQSAEDDEDLYHEVLVQPAMLLHREPRDVLIIGGGEGATLREVLAHASVRTATMVDLDQETVDLCRLHLPTWHRNAFDDPRTRLHFADGRAFVEQADEFYDVVIIDVVDMLDNGPAQRLYTRQFYERLRQRLRPGGIVVVQGLEFSFLDHDQHAALYRTLRSVFSHVTSYAATIPSFLAPWGFLIASDWLDLRDVVAASIDRAIEQRLGPDWLAHLDGAFLLSCTAYDRETRLLLSLPGPILEDDVAYVGPPEIADTWPLDADLPAKQR
ncbi:fused MFS/spermidine synthase [Alsobacter sp. R-9]